MIIRLNSLLSAAVLWFSLAGAALAQIPSGNFETSHSGMYLPSKIDINNYFHGVDIKANGSLMLGYFIKQNLAVGVSGSFSNQYFEIKNYFYNYNTGRLDQSFFTDEKASNVGLYARQFIPVSSSFLLSIGVSIGSGSRKSSYTIGDSTGLGFTIASDPQESHFSTSYWLSGHYQLSSAILFELKIFRSQWQNYFVQNFNSIPVTISYDGIGVSIGLNIIINPKEILQDKRDKKPALIFK